MSTTVANELEKVNKKEEFNNTAGDKETSGDYSENRLD